MVRSRICGIFTLIFSGCFITRAILVFLNGFVRLHVDDNTGLNVYGSCCIVRFVCYNEKEKTRPACQVHLAKQTHSKKFNVKCYQRGHTTRENV